ncbi:sigma-54-dependent transcriptional regulator [Ulvibacter litoralis]|uniref:Two-component system, NtrC family, response regulator HydG n=1 Tax=Ulvibacter litoralis TaxID=227084 RepID=A0A1G7CTA3_9FLAO|nr:sigma-54 dependent transcriptional regulator [Ulvibacter litoralis]GHC46135.1 sigma-54-dependent Fis family transcriptional regulator [Ulvibacter litoralis]SDE42592.1 two-component system, NtrC family, response regulator HydG [Ulvibacter litoralis]
MKNKILIVEDDIAFGKMIANFLERRQFEVQIATNSEEAKTQIETQKYQLLITDLQLPDGSGLELLDFSRKNAKKTQTILMTGYAEVSTAVEAIKKGALDYISKPFRPEELVMIIEQALETENKEVPVNVSEEKKQPAKEIETVKSGFVAGNSGVSKKFNEYLKLVGPTQMNVLLQGESGTGKEVAANAIHNFSDRKDKNFVAVDCGAIPKEIAASEFFGHIKGSFTGAITDKKGHFEAAHLGTLFLDEVGNLSYENQIQLLRALQERKIKPVGSSKEIEVDVRIVTATNEDLVKAVSEGNFREDLYHRLNEFSIQIPSLRERTEDLFLFTHYFLEQANASLGKNVIGLSKQVEEAFKRYAWPGNLRELKNVIKRSVLLTNSSLIPLDVIPREVMEASEKKAAPKDFSKNSNEKQLIINALKEAGNNKSRAAKLLNITRKTLYNKLEQYQIEL